MQTAPSPRMDALLRVAILLPILLLTLVLYTFFHESGHALVGLLLGGRMTAFSANFLNLSAHVGLDGNFTPLQNAVISAAGVSFPLLLWAVFMWIVPKKGDPVLELIKLLVSVCTVCSLLAWVVLPVVVLSGGTAGDDSVNFLGYTHLPPLLVTGAALLVFCAGLAFLLSRIGGLRGFTGHFQFTAASLRTDQARRTMGRAAAVGVIFLASTFALSLAFPDKGPLAVPEGFQPAAQVSFQDKAYENEPAFTFTLDQPAQVRFFFTLQDFPTGPQRIRITGPGGLDFSFLYFTDPKSNIGRATVKPDPLNLNPGQYQILLTFPRGSGKIGIYWSK